MGYQYGLLMHDEINALVPETLDYLYSQIDQYLAFLPKARGFLSLCSSPSLISFLSLRS